MYSHTVVALEKYDNERDFERMCADILIAQGHKDVVLIAPRGGSDGGMDITFTTESGGKGLACVTLRKNIEKKFDEDFSKRKVGEFEKYILFCTAYLTAQQKLKFAKYCLNTLQAEFVPQDIEALRSLLDSLLKPIRNKYLDIQDNKITRQKIKRILFNPLSEVEAPEAWHALALAAELDTYGLYNVLKDEDIYTIAETPEEHNILSNFVDNFTKLRKSTIDIDSYISSTIGTITNSAYDPKWDAIHQYCVLRSFRWDKETTEKRTAKRIWYVTNPDFNACEKVYEILKQDQNLQSLLQTFSSIYQEYKEIREAILELEGFKL